MIHPPIRVSLPVNEDDGNVFLVHTRESFIIKHVVLNKGQRMPRVTQFSHGALEHRSRLIAEVTPRFGDELDINGSCSHCAHSKFV